MAPASPTAAGVHAQQGALCYAVLHGLIHGLNQDLLSSTLEFMLFEVHFVLSWCLGNHQPTLARYMDKHHDRDCVGKGCKSPLHVTAIPWQSIEVLWAGM